MPKGHTVRKVRASQGRIADNVSRRRLPGKCNRNRPPALRRVRMERRGKSSPVSMVTWIRCKPYPKQHRMGIVCPTHIPGWHAAKSRGAARRRAAKTDGRPRQNPAYRQSGTKHPRLFESGVLCASFAAGIRRLFCRVPSQAAPFWSAGEQRAPQPRSS